MNIQTLETFEQRHYALREISTDLAANDKASKGDIFRLLAETLFTYAYPENGTTVLMAADTDGPAGFAYLSKPKGGCAVRVQYLHVLKACRGMGVGRALLEECKRRAVHLQLACKPDMESYYRSCGFNHMIECPDSSDIIMGTTRKATQKNIVWLTPSQTAMSMASDTVARLTA